MNIRRKIGLLFCVLSIPALCFAVNTQEIECQALTKKLIEQPASACKDICKQARQFDGYNYHAGLLAAHATPQGLRDFMAYTARSSLMGAGAEEQACHVYALLLKWGDHTFAKTATQSGTNTKIAVVGLLDYAAVSNFKKRFPKTYGLVSDHDE